MLTEHPHDLELERVRALWIRTATMQGIVCVACLEAPAMEHRDAFFDTGLCQRCAPQAKRPGAVN
jgi:hypothetical protein